MKHITSKNDWFYELKPYLILSLGFFGLLAKSLLGLPTGFSIISFLSALVLLGAGSYILTARKEHRRKSLMTM
jgi:hypothetical protein